MLDSRPSASGGRGYEAGDDSPRQQAVSSPAMRGGRDEAGATGSFDDFNDDIPF